jgi:hypothetical protein
VGLVAGLDLQRLQGLVHERVPHFIVGSRRRISPVKLRWHFPGIIGNVQARACAKAIAGWKPLNLPPRPPVRLRRRSRPD